MLVVGEAPHRGDDLVEADRLRVEHRSALGRRETIAREVDDVDVARPQRDALLEDARAFVDQREDAALHDLVRR